MKQSFEQSGKIGPVVAYILNGKQVMRTLPKKMPQTDATKKRSANFGVAARISSAIYNNAPGLFKTKDSTRYSRLNGAVANWFGILPPAEAKAGRVVALENFKINIGKQMVETFSSKLVIKPTGNTLEITTGDFSPKNLVKAFAGTTSLDICISSLAVDIMAGNCMASDSVRIAVPYNDELIESQTFVHRSAAAPGTLLLCGVSIRYLTDSGDFKLRKGYHLPAKFALAAYSG